MAVSKAQIKATAKYEAKTYDKTLIRLPKGRLDEIRAHIEPAGESLNGFIGRAITEAMERDGGGAVVGTPAAAGPQEAAGGPQGSGGISLPPDVLETVQRAAEVTGETVVDFISRAVATQAQRDKSSLRMGVNPVTGQRVQNRE